MKNTRVLLTSLSFGFAALLGVNAQATENNFAKQDDPFTCILDGLKACASEDEAEMETCAEQVFEECLQGGYLDDTSW